MSRILLIDDDSGYRTMLKIWLERVGYELTEATNGESGLKLYGQSHYDLVITDLYMPEMDGVHLICRLIKEFNFPKIIAMTGASSAGRSDYLLNIAKECGASEVYHKASHINHLLIKIKNLLQKIQG